MWRFSNCNKRHLQSTSKANVYGTDWSLLPKTSITFLKSRKICSRTITLHCLESRSCNNNLQSSDLTERNLNNPSFARATSTLRFYTAIEAPKTLYIHIVTGKNTSTKYKNKVSKIQQSQNFKYICQEQQCNCTQDIFGSGN